MYCVVKLWDVACRPLDEDDHQPDREDRLLQKLHQSWIKFVNGCVCVSVCNVCGFVRRQGVLAKDVHDGRLIGAQVDCIQLSFLFRPRMNGFTCLNDATKIVHRNMEEATARRIWVCDTQEDMDEIQRVRACCECVRLLFGNVCSQGFDTRGYPTRMSRIRPRHTIVDENQDPLQDYNLDRMDKKGKRKKKQQKKKKAKDIPIRWRENESFNLLNQRWGGATGKRKRKARSFFMSQITNERIVKRRKVDEEEDEDME